MPFHVHHHDDESSHTGLRHDAPPLPPTGMQRQASMNTRYMKMLLDLDSVPGWHNLLAAISAWLLLAGFVIFPGTFTSIQTLDAEDEGFSNVERWVLKRVRNLPLLVVAGLCCGIGALGMLAFWIRWRRNYVWLCNRIFLPGTLHSIAGLLSTLINVYTAQHKQWSITARVSAVVEGISLAVCGLLWIVYSYWLLGGVKRNHRREFGLREDDLPINKR